MESKQNTNVNMIKFVLLCVFLTGAHCRIHKLTLENDRRKEITLSTFGFLSGGTLAINITSFGVKTKSDLPTANRTVVGFTLDKSKSPGLSSYMEGMQETCILNNPKVKTDNMESIFFHFDFKQSRVRIERVGDDMKSLVISKVEREYFIQSHDLNRRAVTADGLTAKLSDSYLVGSRRKVREAVTSSTLHPKSTGSPLTPNKTEDKKTSTPAMMAAKPAVLSSTTVTTKVSKLTTSLGSKEAVEKVLLEDVVLNLNGDGTFQTYFLVYIKKPEEEGLYNLFFHNCLRYGRALDASIDMTIMITEDNNGNFLTAGEMPVPAVYFTFSVLFFIAGVAWLSVLRRSKEDVYKIHYLMLVVVFVKSLSCLFHGVNMYFIQKTGIHEDAWAILWYIVYLTRGALMFVTVLLIGAGWAFIKHVLTDREKKLFLIIIPLQVLDRVAEVIVEESEEGNQSYMTWKEIFILVDLLCCGAILFPVVWSIRHLQEASSTDGKAAINLQKLKLFRHFYILVVCYIYFTRIIVYLMKITLPFKLEWLTEMFTELAMMVFLVVTGVKFRPATDNPYLQVPLDSDDEEEIEMEEVLTKTGSTEGAVRVNQKTEGATNQIKQRESSHEYD
uniref:G protein-coupled receptor n=1 Tax=Littorina littorea TaxID=31216 RepID=C1IE03_LITLI|nr:G protein-coupled receptor [Littorina littorea]